jgi:hypothetical protein
MDQEGAEGPPTKEQIATTNTTKTTTTTTTITSTPSKKTTNEDHQPAKPSSIYASTRPQPAEQADPGEMPTYVHLSYWTTKQRRKYHIFETCAKYAGRTRLASHITRAEAEETAWLTMCSTCKQAFDKL